MKNTGIGIIVLALLAFAAYYFAQKDGQSDKVREIMKERDFLLEDKSDVYSFHITHKSGREYRFERNGEDWTFNKYNKASTPVVESILQIFTKSELNHIPTKKGTENLLSSFDKIGIKVEFFDKEKKEIKTVLVGSDASYGKGTHMMLEGGKQPYAMSIPLINGGFRSRLTYEFEQIYDKEFISYEADELNSVTVIYPKDQSSSFTVINENGKYNVKVATDFQEESKLPVNENRARAYMEGLTSLYIEGWDNSNSKRDSIDNLIPFVEINIDVKDGADREIRLYPFNDFLDKNVHVEEWEQAKRITRYFVAEDKQFAIGQQRVLKHLLRPYNHFFTKDES